MGVPDVAVGLLKSSASAGSLSTSRDPVWDVVGGATGGYPGTEQPSASAKRWPPDGMARPATPACWACHRVDLCGPFLGRDQRSIAPPSWAAVLVESGDWPSGNGDESDCAK